MKTAEELMAFSQGNLEAMVKSGQIWAAGVQDIGKLMAATAQACSMRRCRLSRRCPRSSR